MEQQKFTAEDVQKMDKKQKQTAARRNMRAAMDAVGIDPRDLGQLIEIDDDTLDRRFSDGKWSQKEIRQMREHLHPDDKAQLYNPKGFQRQSSEDAYDDEE